MVLNIQVVSKMYNPLSEIKYMNYNLFPMIEQINSNTIESDHDEKCIKSDFSQIIEKIYSHTFLYFSNRISRAFDSTFVQKNYKN